MSTESVESFAASLLAAQTLAEKLRPCPADLAFQPQTASAPPTRPRRPQKLGFARHRDVRVPPISGFHDRHQRARILHALANHELQAAEVFAWALLAFSDMPLSFRRGLRNIMIEEQRHCALYLERLRALDADFGDFGVTGHFWHHLDNVKEPLDFICTFGLTFENANLDFASDYAEVALQCNDHDTAAVLERVHDDELTHVHFAWTWFLKLIGTNDDPWARYVEHIHWPLHPGRARGANFRRQARERAGLSTDFIARLQGVQAKRPSGAPR